jgi:hypothetical protein
MTGAMRALPYRRPARIAAAGAVLLYLGLMSWYARYHVLDDALIHLRLAELLLEHGFVTTDGEAVSFGTSSPLFLLLTTALHAAIPSDFTTKIISIAAYGGLLALLTCLIRRGTALERASWATLAMLVVSPMGIRWLTDGMETGLAAVVSIALGLTAIRARAESPSSAFWLAMLGAVAIGMRIEMVLLVALASATAGVRGERLAANALAAGGAIGLMLLWAIFGTVLPDPALAKAAGAAMPAASLAGLATSFAGGMAFGTGLLTLWLLSTTAAWHVRTAPRLVIVLPNLALLLFWAAIALRGQYIQGIRHLIPALAFMLAANIALVGAAEPRALVARLLPSPRWRKPLGYTAAAIVALAFVAELGRFESIVENRSAAFLEMRALDLEALEDADGIAWDVGHVMYFTKGQVCDVSGIVNGRNAALVPGSARLENCLKRDLEFLFVTPENAAELIERSGQRFADWTVCGQYLFQNVSETAPHYLAVSPARAARICPRPREKGSLFRATLRAM